MNVLQDFSGFEPGVLVNLHQKPFLREKLQALGINPLYLNEDVKRSFRPKMLYINELDALIQENLLSAGYNFSTDIDVVESGMPEIKRSSEDENNENNSTSVNEERALTLFWWWSIDMTNRCKGKTWRDMLTPEERALVEKWDEWDATRQEEN